MTKSNISAQVAACENKLQQLQVVISKQQWDILDFHTDAYQQELSNLGGLYPADNPPLHHADEFIQLLNQQRRVMRILNQALQTTSEDIDSTNKGLNQVKRVKGFTQA